ncbi:predicted protein [Uncinocarpus reesii 1704]|uniref:Uncharacterized protein n=1 Tax=Uncinocarpus reesii (strain UAMH 1704) TaxID=336963 RepID=C4JHN7_UNCRE|nr:uncharacterized protein UREG_02723 [Uncinocarpus reesii 1704]EEP77874.1 predicted protein [Uncinocarpus reesii 1704]
MSFFTPDRGLTTTVDGVSVTGLQAKEALTRHSSLAIYGNTDPFTAVRKLRKWSQELSSMPNSQFRFLEINGAGHFWREDGTESLMRNAIRGYI